MTIINEANYGETTYIVSLATGLAWVEQYQVAAYHEAEAVDLVADYIEEHGYKGLYFEHMELEVMAKCSQWQTADAFAEAHNLTCCGNHGIYLEITNIEGCPNG